MRKAHQNNLNSSEVERIEQIEQKRKGHQEMLRSLRNSSMVYMILTHTTRLWWIFVRKVLLEGGIWS